jgi:hypothetical protein
MMFLSQPTFTVFLLKNETKKEVVEIPYYRYLASGPKIHPLPLVTVTSNGGGYYDRINIEYVVSWSVDKL